MAPGRTLLLVGAVLAAGGGRAGAQSGLPTSPFGYAVFGMDRVTLGPRVHVEIGAVGTNRGVLALKRGARVAGEAAAFEIRMQPGASARRLSCLFLQGFQGFCKSVKVPLFEVLPLVQAVPGVTDVSVPPHRFSVPVPEGKFGRIRVGFHATLLLAGGAYDARKLDLSAHARLLCQTDCVISLGQRARIGPRSAIRAADIDPIATLRINVLGEKAGRAFVSGPGSRITGLVYAPTGALLLGRGGHYLGTFIGRTVTVRPGAVVRFES